MFETIFVDVNGLCCQRMSLNSHPSVRWVQRAILTPLRPQNE